MASLFDGPEKDECGDPNTPYDRMPLWLQTELLNWFIDDGQDEVDLVDEAVAVLEDMSEDQIEDEILAMYDHPPKGWPKQRSS